jgi:maleylacetate reductase
MQFEHSLATPRVLFGAGYTRRLPAEAERLGGDRILLFVDQGRPLVDQVAALLSGHVVGHVGDIREHVPVEQAEQATQQAETLRADLLVAAGGGSTIGTAKAVARRTGTPILAVPTTFAGSEMTPIWGETSGRVKTTGRDARVLPRTVIYDPDLVLSLPSHLAASSGMNALAHCAEAVYDPGCSPLTKLGALEGARVLVEQLAELPGPDPSAALPGLLYGSWLAGLALGNATMGLHHKLCHVLGGMQRLSHGGLHSDLLPNVLAFEEPAAGDDLRRLADSVGSDDAADAVWRLGRALGTPPSLDQLGFDRANVDEAVAAVLATPPQSPRSLDEASLTDLLTAACDGLPPHAIRD